MNGLIRALSAETLKTKRTLALAMTGLAPLAIALLQFGVYLDRAGHPVVPPGESLWLRFSQNMFIYWTLLMLPLFVTLETALLSGLDQTNKNWKLLYTLPVPRWAYYAAKQIMSLVLIGASIIVLVILIFLVARLLQSIDPTSFDFSAPAPITHILKYALLTFLAAWFIISLHVWISMRWKSFVIACGAGIVATVCAVFVIQSDWGFYYPWTLAGIVASKMIEDEAPLMSVALGALGGIFVALVGGWDVSRQDVL